MSLIGNQWKNCTTASGTAPRDPKDVPGIDLNKQMKAPGIRVDFNQSDKFHSMVQAIFEEKNSAMTGIIAKSNPDCFGFFDKVEKLVSFTMGDGVFNYGSSIGSIHFDTFGDLAEYCDLIYCEKRSGFLAGCGRNGEGERLADKSTFPQDIVHMRNMFRTSETVGGASCKWWDLTQKDIKDECGVRFWLDKLQPQHPAIAATQVKSNAGNKIIILIFSIFRKRHVRSVRRKKDLFC